MKKRHITIILLCLGLFSTAQDELYQKSYDQLNQMLQDITTYSFKKAVFSVENAYYKGRLDTLMFENKIKLLTLLSKGLVNSRSLIYNGKDLDEVEKCAAVFSLMTDSIPIAHPDGETFVHLPFQYDFNDPFGHENWENMFVTKLLQTHKGNCHSLPYLYKILAEELDTKAHLALAPSHVYIKHFNEKDGWFNTELTSGVFPRDAWLMASGYIHLDAIKNGVYLKALNDKESIALCMLDLALGYTKQLNYNPDFVLKCVNKALEIFPNFASAHVLKTEAKGKKLHQLLDENELTFDIADQLPKADGLKTEIEKDLRHIHELGYRQMPESMYLDWLISLKTEQEKYINQKLRTFK